MMVETVGHIVPCIQGMHSTWNVVNAQSVDGVAAGVAAAVSIPLQHSLSEPSPLPGRDAVLLGLGPSSLVLYRGACSAQHGGNGDDLATPWAGFIHAALMVLPLQDSGLRVVVLP